MRNECSSTVQLLDVLDKAEWVRAVDSTMEVEGICLWEDGSVVSYVASS